MVMRVIDQGWSVSEAAQAAGVSERTCWKWLGRYRRQGQSGLLDRSSAPVHIPHKTPEDRVHAIVALRRLRMTAAELSEIFAMALSTTSAVLRRVGLGKCSRLAPPRATQPL